MAVTGINITEVYLNGMLLDTSEYRMLNNVTVVLFKHPPDTKINHSPWWAFWRKTTIKQPLPDVVQGTTEEKNTVLIPNVYYQPVFGS